MVEKIIAIVPAHNEEKNIRLVIDSLKESVRAGVISDFVVVANGCSDKTYSKSITRGANTLKMPIGNKGAAFIQGVKWAQREGASVIVTIDADAKRFNPSSIKHLVKPVIKKQTPMTITTAVLKGNKIEFPPEYSGFRAISMKALKPIIAGNRDWVKQLTIGKYSLELGLNTKIFGIHHTELNFLRYHDSESSRLVDRSVLPPLFVVRRGIRDPDVCLDFRRIREHVLKRKHKLSLLTKQRARKKIK